MSVTGWGGVTLTVEAALGTTLGGIAQWNAGIWDTDVWGADEVYVDITVYCRSIMTKRGKQRETGVYEAGSATLVLDNRDARFSPSNLSGPYVSAGLSMCRPWRPFRIRATYAGTTYSVFTGYFLSLQESTPGDLDYITTIVCTDETGLLAAYTNLPLDTAVGAGELSGQRIHRILDNAVYPGNRAIDPGYATMQATTLGGNTVQLLQLTTDSEDGAWFADADGTIVFENQHALNLNTRSTTSQATFGDAGSELPYHELTEAPFDGDLVVNTVDYQRVGGAVQHVTDVTSRVLYRDHKIARSDLICDQDTQVNAIASFLLARRKDPELRFEGMTVLPQAAAATLYPQVLGRRLRDRITVVRRPNSTANETISRDVFIEGVEHTITPELWSTRFSFSSATFYVLTVPDFWNDTAALWDSTGEQMLTAPDQTIETGIGSWATVSTSSVLSQQTSAKRSGSFGMRSRSSVTGTVTNATAPYGVGPSVSYTFSGYVKASTTNRANRLGMQWQDASHAIISTTIGATVTSSTTNFQQLTVTDFAPANAYEAVLLHSTLSATTNDDQFLDDFSLIPGTVNGPATWFY